MKKIYLGIPYSGQEETSYELAKKYAAQLLKEGHLVFSPISMCHPISKDYDLPGDWSFWEKLDTSFIEWCDEVIFIVPGDILGLKNFLASKGCRSEYDIATTLKKPVKFMSGLTGKIGNKNLYKLGVSYSSDDIPF